MMMFTYVVTKNGAKYFLAAVSNLPAGEVGLFERVTVPLVHERQRTWVGFIQ